MEVRVSLIFRMRMEPRPHFSTLTPKLVDSFFRILRSHNSSLDARFNERNARNSIVIGARLAAQFEKLTDSYMYWCCYTGVKRNMGEGDKGSPSFGPK